MAARFSNAAKLRIQFRKTLRKGHIKNAELDPTIPLEVALLAEPEEPMIVRVDSTKEARYWFSDRRLLRQGSDGVHELLRYDSVIAAHWMFKNLSNLVRQLDTEQFSHLKLDHFDRIEVEVQGNVIVLDGMDQAYFPVLQFFWWINRA